MRVEISMWDLILLSKTITLPKIESAYGIFMNVFQFGGAGTIGLFKPKLTMM